MFLFKKKTPEEKATARLEKLRRDEACQGFAAALMHPVGDLALGDVSIVRLYPDTQELAVTCHKKRHAVPYKNLRSVSFASEKQIYHNEGPISSEEMNTLLENGADQFVEPMQGHKNKLRWFMRLDYATDEGDTQSIYGLLCTARGYYASASKLYAADQFEVIFADILSRFQNTEQSC